MYIEMMSSPSLWVSPILMILSVVRDVSSESNIVVGPIKVAPMKVAKRNINISLAISVEQSLTNNVRGK